MIDDYVYDNTNGRKLDSDKTRYELIPPEALEALARLYTKGAQKYEADNWAKGMSWRRVFGALMRHAWAWMRGEENDPETNENHMIAVAWNAFTLYIYQIRNLGQDDRPKL